MQFRLSVMLLCARLRAPGTPHQQRSKQVLARQAVRPSEKAAGLSDLEAHQQGEGACPAIRTGA